MTQTRTCLDLDSEIASLLTEGYRLDMIMPADAPRLARLSRDEDRIELRMQLHNAEIAENTEEIFSAGSATSALEPPKAGTHNTGRAGMQYRDLILDRLGGFLIASHIRITRGGEVPDYVHYHKLRFQMIYCRSGWVRVVYEDQGSPFVMNAGDCVLQPPEIRHRVLEASEGAEVIELSSPAIHETWVDHDLTLPTSTVDPERDYSGQRFVRHVAADADWLEMDGLRYRDTGIAAATNGRADARVLRIPQGAVLTLQTEQTNFIYVLDGKIVGNQVELDQDDSFVVRPDDDGKVFTASENSEVLHVTLSEEMSQFFFAVSVPTDLEP